MNGIQGFWTLEIIKKKGLKCSTKSLSDRRLYWATSMLFPRNKQVPASSKVNTEQSQLHEIGGQGLSSYHSERAHSELIKNWWKLIKPISHLSLFALRVGAAPAPLGFCCIPAPIDLALPVSSLTIYWRQPLRLMLSEETLIWRCAVTESNGTHFEAPLCVACPMWAVRGLLRPIIFEGETQWLPTSATVFSNSNTIYIFPIDPGKSYLGLALTISVYWSFTSPKCRSQLQLSVAQDIYIQGFLPQT